MTPSRRRRTEPDSAPVKGLPVQFVSVPADPARHAAAITAALEEARTVHQLAQGSIGAADGKAQWAASIALTTLGALFTAQALLGPPDNPSLLVAGLALLFASVAMAGLAVVPRLRSPKKDVRAPDPMYFGELRQWYPAGLANHLVDQPPEARLEAWCRQATQLGRIAWRKHRWARRALLAALGGAALSAVAYLWPQLVTAISQLR
jgi:hypothetical protein